MDTEYKKLLKGGKWAENATDNIAPDDSSISPTLTRTIGFPSAYSQQSGGVKPDRRRINQILRELSGGAFEVRMGVSPYDAEVDYPVDAITQVSGLLYRAALTNGPSSTVVNPIGGSPTWVPVTGSISEPEAPRAFLFDNAITNQIDVRWKNGRDGGSEIDQYDFQYRIVNDAPEEVWSPSSPLRIQYAQYTIAPLTSGQQVQVRARAITRQGEISDWAKSTIGDTSDSKDRVRGGRPGGGNAMGLLARQSNTVARLTWNAPEDGGFPILRYVVQWTSSGNFGSSNQVISATDLTEDISGLAYDTEWSFRVAAENSQGRGEWSNEATLTLADPSLTSGLPNLFAPNISERTGSSFTANAHWSSHATLPTATPTSAVWQWRRTSGGGGWTTATHTGLNGFSVSGLSANTSYQIRYQLNTPIGTAPSSSTYSPVATINTSVSAGTPGTPSVSVSANRTGGALVGQNYNVRVNWTEAAPNGNAIDAYYARIVWAGGATQSGGSRSISLTGANHRSTNFGFTADVGSSVTAYVSANNGSQGAWGSATTRLP